MQASLDRVSGLALQNVGSEVEEGLSAKPGPEHQTLSWEGYGKTAASSPARGPARRGRRRAPALCQAGAAGLVRRPRRPPLLFLGPSPGEVAAQVAQMRGQGPGEYSDELS